MRIYIFKSETRAGLHAFAADQMGNALPENHGPWTVTGMVGTASAPPHGMSRETIEGAIEAHGFQMWRLSKKEKASA